VAMKAHKEGNLNNIQSRPSKSESLYVFDYRNYLS